MTKPGHIGIATGPSRVIHASDTHVGVIEASIDSGNWKRCGRMKASFWLRQKLTPGSVDFTSDAVETFH